MAINLNKYIIESEEVEVFRSIVLFKAIINRYFLSELSLMHQRGQVLVYGIFISLSISISIDSYFLFTSIPLDHRVL